MVYRGVCGFRSRVSTITLIYRYMKVTSTKTISFPKFNWGIHKGEFRDLPEDKKAMEAILAHPCVQKSGDGATKSASKSKSVDK